MPRLKDALTPPANLSEWTQIPPSAAAKTPPPIESMPGFSSLSLAPSAPIMSTDTDRARQFYRPGVSQQRIPTLPVKANPQVAAVTRTIIQQSSSPSTTTNGFNFRGVWQSFFTYAPNDSVLFNNSLYFATQTSTSAEPDTNSSSWTLFSQNLNFRGQFQSQIVQAVAFGPFGAGGQTITGTLPISTAGNSFVVVAYGPSRSFSTLTCTDSQGNGYTQEEFNVTNVQTTAVFFVSGIKGGASNVFTLTCDAGHVIGNTRFVVYEILGPTTFGSASISVTPGSGASTSAATYTANCTAGQMAVSYLGNVSAAGYTSLNAALGFNFDLVAANTDVSEVNMNPVPVGGVISAGFNATTALSTVFAQATFTLNYATNRYEPYDAVIYEGSTYVCVSSTSSTPSASNASWYLLSQGESFAQVLTANYSATANDVGKTLVFNSPTGVTLQLPATVPNSSWTINVQNIGAGAVSISPNGLNLDNSTSNLSVAQNSGLKICSDGQNYYTVRGVSGGGALTKISEVILSASQSTVTFSSIPATFRNLVLVVNARTDIAAGGQNGYI